MNIVDNIAVEWLEQKERLENEKTKLEAITEKISDLPEFKANSQNDYGSQKTALGENYRIKLTRPITKTWDATRLKDLDYPEIIEYVPKVLTAKLNQLPQEDQDKINACSTLDPFNKKTTKYLKPKIKVETNPLEEMIHEDIAGDI